MIRRFLFALRRVIVRVMARAAVPQNSNAFGSESQQQLGFDFGAPGTDAASSRASVPDAHSAITQAVDTAVHAARGSTTPELLYGASSVRDTGVLPEQLRSASSVRETGVLPELLRSASSVRETGVLPFQRSLHVGGVAPDANRLQSALSAAVANVHALPQLAASLSEVSPFGVAGGLVAPAPVAPVAPQLSKSRGRAAVRARTAVLFSRLQELGLRGIDSLVLMRTRTVMVSLIGQTLRVHEGYADAPEPVLRAIVTFATARHRATRAAARDEILKHEVERAPANRRVEPARPGDVALISSLMQAHREMNVRSFSGSLNEIPIRLSGRMATRLGHFDPGSRLTPPEIVMSRRHVVKHGWKEAMHTLLHEMVHQWQHETGQPVDHLAGFRKKCREVGITPAARRDVTPIKPRRRSGAA